MKADFTKSIKYKVGDLKRLRKKYKPGMLLKLTRRHPDDDGYLRDSVMVCEVVRSFPHFVSCLDPYGQRISPDYIELEEHAVIIG